MVPHALELHAVGPQHLLDAHALLEHTEIHPHTHAASCVLAHIVNGWPLLSTAIRYATSLRATASVAWLRFPRCSSRSCTAASCGLWRGASLAASIRIVCRCLLRCLEIGSRCSWPAEPRCALVSPP